jgi:hypothetical protein
MSCHDYITHVPYSLSLIIFDMRITLSSMLPTREKKSIIKIYEMLY